MKLSSRSKNNWIAITGLVSELRRCDNSELSTASLAMAFICIDTLANLARPSNQSKVTRKDFIEWVDLYLKGHPDQPYRYRGKDVYAARCAFLHTYGAEATLHTEDSDTIMFVYHDGGKHIYAPDKNKKMVIIGVKSFIEDIVWGVDIFLKACHNDSELKKRVEQRLEKVFQIRPIIPE